MLKKLDGFIDRYFHLVVTMPATVVVFLLVVFPALYGLYTSLFVRNLLRSQIYFTGLGNYIKLLGDPTFWSYFLHTVIYAGGATVIAFTIALALSVALRNDLRFKPFFIGAILFPWIVPMAASSVAWNWVLDSVYGLYNYIFVQIGILDAPYYFLGNPVSGMMSMIVVEAWFSIPLLTLIMYAGLQRVPDELYEIAQIDGANAWRRFLQITLPLIKPEMLMSLVLVSMFAFRRFVFPYLLTGGGPGGKTEVLAITIYKESQQFLRQGYGAAIGIVMLIVICAFVYAYFRLFRGEEGKIGVEL